MPVCIVCEADGVLELNGGWYCKEHLSDALYAFAELVTTILGHAGKYEPIDVLEQLMVSLYIDEQGDSLPPPFPMPPPPV